MAHASPDTVTISVDFDDVADYPEVPSVGTVYEVALSGVGYMLADDPERQIEYQRGTMDLLPQRFATTESTLGASIERYTFVHDDDWSAGAGQRYGDRPGSSASRYWDSEGVDPFTVEGGVGLLNATEELLDSAYAGLRVVVAGDRLYALTGDDDIRWTDDGVTWDAGITVTDGAAVTISDLASDGQFWYGATGGSVVRGTTTNPGAAWSTQDAVSVRWAAGRICAAVKVSSSTPNRFTTLGPTGVEELVGGHLTLEAGHTIVLGGSAQGVFWFGSYAGERGQIWAWQLGLDSEGNAHVPYVAWELPQGLIPTAVASASGEVWVRAYQAEGPSSGETFVYRAVPGSGLTPILVAELGVTHREGVFDEHSDLVLFSWQDTAGDAALGAVSLVSGGYARWSLAGAEGPIRSIVTWGGLETFTVAGRGVYAKDADAYEPTGWVTSSITNGASTLDKVWDVIEVATETQLAASESIEIEATLNEGETYVDVGSLTGAGAHKAVLDLSKKSMSLGLRYTLNGDGTSATILALASRRFFPLGLSDIIVIVPIDCNDTLRGLGGHELAENGAGAGYRRARLLEGLTQRRVKFQDIDWPVTRESHVYTVVNSQVRAEGVMNRNLGRKEWRQIVTLTLRRSA